MTRRIVIVGGSDAGISAALRARQVDPTADVEVIVADRFPNYSICGILFFLSGEVEQSESLAHRTAQDIEAAGVRLRLDTRAVAVEPGERRVRVEGLPGTEWVPYDSLVLPPRTSRGGSPARMPPGVTRASPGSSARRW